MPYNVANKFAENCVELGRNVSNIVRRMETMRNLEVVGEERGGACQMKQILKQHGFTGSLKSCVYLRLGMKSLIPPMSCPLVADHSSRAGGY